MKYPGRFLLVLAIAFGLLWPAAQPVRAENISLTVTSTSDDPSLDCQTGHPCSLRGAINRVNNEPQNHFTIHLQEGVTYTLTLDGSREDANNSGDLDILRSVEIMGHGAVIDGNQIDRVLDLHGGTIFISGLTIENGQAPHGGDPRLGGSGNGENGGGIQVRSAVASLTLLDCMVQNNLAGEGGTATAGPIPQAGISGGSGGSGGGIYAVNPVLRISYSTIQYNYAGDGGDGAPGGQPQANAGLPGYEGGAGGSGGGGGGVMASGYVEVRYSDISSNTAGEGGTGGEGGQGDWGPAAYEEPGYPGGTGGVGGPGGPGGNGGGIHTLGSEGNFMIFSSLVSANVSGSGGKGGPGGSGGPGGPVGSGWGDIGSGGNGGRGGFGGSGGAIYNTRALTLYTTTLSNNIASRGGAGGAGGFGTDWGLPGSDSAHIGGEGGGLYHAGSELSTYITFSTVYNNTANSGGGMYASKTLKMQASVLDENSVYMSAPDCATLWMTSQITSYGYNLVHDPQGCALTKADPAGPDDLTGMSAGLGGLQYINGDSYGHPPAPTSPVVDLAPCLDIHDAHLTSDQAGDYTRPSGVRCDAGAVEYQWAAAVYLPVLSR